MTAAVYGSALMPLRCPVGWNSDVGPNPFRSDLGQVTLIHIATVHPAANGNVVQRMRDAVMEIIRLIRYYNTMEKE